MKIHVPPSAREHFWEELPEVTVNLWAFKSKPRCKIGDELIFMFDGRPVATARVSGIEPPRLPWREGGKEWRVFWHQKSFQALELPVGRGLTLIQGPEPEPEPGKPSRVINASEVREFVYCPRSWKLKRGGAAPPPAAKTIKQQKVEKGDRYNLEHGKAVVQTRQPEMSGCWRAAGWALTMMGAFWWVFSY